jgi:acetyl esterase
MVAASADYRLKRGHDSGIVQSVEDAKSAIRWLRENAPRFGIDPGRIVAAGGSAGGHLAACAALCDGIEPQGEDFSVSSKPNALVLFNPVLDISEVLQHLGKDRPENERWAKLISPTLSMHKGAPPAILFYGAKDRLIIHGRQFVERAKRAGNRAEMVTFEGQKHGFFNDSPWRERTLQLADKFLASLGDLQGEPTVKVPAK